MNSELSVTLLHDLPGRLRIRLSRPPVHSQRFLDAVRAHEGIQKTDYSPRTRSVLIEYETGHLSTQELLLRSAMAFSVEYEDAPVLVSTEPESGAVTDGAVAAGFLLAAAGLVRWVGKGKANSLLDRTAGMGVAAAVLQHGWHEARQKGHVDPELLSLGYLITAFMRGKTLRGAAITWVASFGRHLLLEETTSVEVRPLRKGNAAAEPEQYQVALVSGNPSKSPVLAMAQAVLRSFGIALAAGGGGGALLDELRSVAQTHGEVMEGLSGMQKQGIPLIFK